VPQAFECFVGVLEREGLGVRAHQNLRGLPEKSVTVLARVVCHTAEAALPIEELVGQFRDRAHVDAAEHEGAALVEVGERGGYDLAGGSEDDAGVE